MNDVRAHLKGGLNGSILLCKWKCQNVKLRMSSGARSGKEKKCPGHVDKCGQDHGLIWLVGVEVSN